MVDIGRDHCGSSGPTQPTTARRLLNFLKEGDSTTSLGNLCQCSITFNIKTCYLVFRQNRLCSSLYPLPFVVALGTTEKSLSPSSLHFPFRYFYTLIRSMSCPLSSSPTSRTFPSLFWTVPALSPSSQERCSSRFIIFMVLCWTLSSMSVSLLSFSWKSAVLEYQECSTRV